MELDPRRIILECARTNQKYMDLRAGRAGYPKMVGLYRRIAEASVELAMEYSSNARSPSPHEPVVDAFWSAVATWSAHFTMDLLDLLGSYGGTGLQADTEAAAVRREIGERFIRPHQTFAMWLRPGMIHIRPSPVTFTGITPSRLILLHDYHWTLEVIRLTARWGLIHHLKDLPALLEARQLLQGLRRWPPSDAARAYLESDLEFLAELFSHFEFSPEVSGILRGFLGVAKTTVAW